jgi:hypothetical protein
MLYSENGQFKVSYSEDQQILPIVQDRWFMLALLAFAYLAMPAIGTEYLFLSLVVPFLILAIAAMGLNILVGYCGQISLGTAAFMAVGAYAAYNLVVRMPSLNFLVVLALAGGIAALVGVLFGIPSLRIKGLYLAVATLAAQFFIDWVFARVKWFTNYSSSGSVSTPEIEIFDLSHIHGARRLIDAALLSEQPHVQFVMGVQNALPADERLLDILLGETRRVIPGATWTAAGIGREQNRVMDWALARGADAVRTGMEDNIRVSKDRLVSGNAELVTIAAETVAQHGRRPATPAEARAILGLRAA